MSKSFEVTVRGQYQSLNEGSGVPGIKAYEETFNLPSQESALSNICKHLLAPRLRKKHADYVRFRTHELVGIKLVGYTPNKEVLQMGFDEMNLSELHDFCILRQIMIDPFKHGDKDIFKIRAMVQDLYTQKRQAIKDAATSKDSAKQKEADELRKLNDLAPTSTDIILNENEQKLSQAAARQTNKEQTQSQTQSPATESTESMDALPPIEPDEPSLE